MSGSLHEAAPGARRALPLRRRGLVAAVALIALVAVAGAGVALRLSTRSAGLGAGQSAPRALVPGEPPGGAAGWTLALDEEFDGVTFDRRYWSSARFADGAIAGGFNPYELQCFDPRQTTVAGGVARLLITARRETCGGHSRAYASGILTTYRKWSFRYGYVVARVWLPGSGAIADWPSFWAVGAHWPRDGEIDMLEALGEGKACWYFHSAAGAHGKCLSNRLTGGWHTIGADWEPGQITWYWDGLPVHTLTSGVTSAPMVLIIDLAVTNVFHGPLQIPATLSVDYIRVWHRIRT